MLYKEVESLLGINWYKVRDCEMRTISKVYEGLASPRLNPSQIKPLGFWE